MRLLSVFALVCCLSALSGDNAFQCKEVIFQSGGQIELKLEAGGYSIQPWDDNRISIQWKETDPRGVEVKLDTDKDRAHVRIRYTSNHFQAKIFVPRHSDLRAKLTAGELKIGAVKGSKDISCRAGEVCVEMDQPQEYKLVEASVLAGEIDAKVFQANKGGLFRSFSHRGEGQHELHVELMAGEIRFH